LGEGASSGNSDSLGDETESYVVPEGVCVSGPSDLIFKDGFEGGD